MNHLLRSVVVSAFVSLAIWAFVWPASGQAQDSARLWHAAADGNLEEVKSEVKHGANVNFRGPGGFAPLNAAARNGHFEVVQYLVDHGAEIDQCDNTRDKTGSWPPLSRVTLTLSNIWLRKGLR